MLFRSQLRAAGTGQLPVPGKTLAASAAHAVAITQIHPGVSGAVLEGGQLGFTRILQSLACAARAVEFVSQAGVKNRTRRRGLIGRGQGGVGKA